MIGPVLALALVSAVAPAEEAFEVQVDPRVELVTSVFRLAGNDEFNMGVARSPYADAFDERFAAFADHPAVEMARRLRAARGISYNAPATLAVHLTDLETLGERVPLDLPPARLDDRWDAASARAFVEELRRFAQETEFRAWYDEHAALHAAVEERLRSFLAPRLHAEWFPRFFGGAPKGRCVIIPSLLQGGHNYGGSVRFEDGSEELTPCIGLWSWDDEGLPVFDDGALGVVAHELAHAWVNPIVDAHAPALDPPGARIFPVVRDGLRNAAYSTWRIVTYESLVRATVVRWRLEYEGVAAARKQAADDKARGFSWVSGLAERLADYEEDRATYETLDDFVPEVAVFFGEVAAQADRVASARAAAPAVEPPQVVRLTPEDGARDVAPGRSEVRIEFDRAMGPGYSMIILDGVDFPPTAGSPTWDAAGKVFTLPVRLASDHAYGYLLNRRGGGDFRSREGGVLAPLRVEFRTRVP